MVHFKIQVNNEQYFLFFNLSQMIGLDSTIHFENTFIFVLKLENQYAFFLNL